MSVRGTIELSQVDKSACGPTPFSHWVIPNLLLASAYPGETDPDAHTVRTRQFIDAGVQVVVNMMENEELKSRTPYEDTMLQHAKEGNREVEFISFPIPDRSVHADNQRVLHFCLELCDRIKQRQVVLVHCRGGHGRTGIIVSVMIGILFHLESEEALSINCRLHDQRLCTNGFKSPENGRQTDQVRFVLDQMYHKSEANYENEKKNSL